MVGFNLAALKFIQLDYQENDGSFFEDISTKVKSVKKKKRAVLKTVVWRRHIILAALYSGFYLLMYSELCLSFV